MGGSKNLAVLAIIQLYIASYNSFIALTFTAHKLMCLLLSKAIRAVPETVAMYLYSACMYIIYGLMSFSCSYSYIFRIIR